MQAISMVDKKVLMFCRNFFGYHEAMANELRDMGCKVDLYNELPNSGAFCKIMVRYNIGLYRNTILNYYRSIISQNKDKDYDYIFIVKGEATSDRVVELLRRAYPKAQFILYLWDSVKNIPDGENKLSLYDRVLTFDPEDAERYGLILRPLFYSKDYEIPSVSKSDYRYDVAFIGTAHTIRPRVVKQLAQQCDQRGKGSFCYLFLPNRIVYLYNKVLNSDYRNVKKKDIHFDALTPAEIQSVYDETRCILDVESSAQRGLTMRTIEMIGSHKKLITTNKTVEKYDFYNKNNICIVDRENPIVREDFWESEYEPLPQEILRRYCLRAFVEEIFDVKE